MADTGKSIRSARTNFGGGNLGGGLPSERSQLVAQEVHQYRSASEGLEGLNGALDNFFGLASQGIQSVRDGLELGQRVKIEQENAAQKRQAAADAMLGKDMDASMTNDLDYYEAFRAVRSQRDGYQASQDFQSWYLSDWLPENPTGDLGAAREKWAADNLTGSDDPEYEGQLLAAFFGQSDNLISQHTQTAYKYQTQKGIQTQGEAINAKVASGTFTVGDFQLAIEQARVLDPLNAAEAPARVMSALITAANNNPAQAMAVSNLLMQPGTGMNGKSYAESWPENFAEFQASAEQNYSQINTLREAEALDGLKGKYRAAKTPEDYTELLADIVEFHQTFGASESTSAIENGIMTAMGKIEEKVAAQQSASAWMAGDPEGDPKELKENWGEFLKATTGQSNILKLDISTGAQIVQDLRGEVPAILKSQLSAAVSDPRDPAAQARAFQLIGTLAENAGLKYATDYLDDTAASMYALVHNRMVLTDDPMESILGQANEAAKGITDWTVGWDKITGIPAEADWSKKVDTLIRDEVGAMIGTKDLFGPGVNIPPAMLKEVTDMARQGAMLAQASGFGWETGVKNAAQVFAKNVELMPGPDGQTYVRFGVPENQLEYVDEFGKSQKRVRLGKAVHNPLAKDPVNTIDVFRQETKAIKDAHPWIFPGGDADGIALTAPQPDSTLARYGLLTVMDGGKPIVYTPGMEIVPDKKITPFFGQQLVGASITVPGASAATKFPETEAELKALAATMPDGYAFVPITFGNMTSYQLAYRPNFGENLGQTIDQREQGFEQTPLPAEPQAPAGLPMGTIDPAYSGLPQPDGYSTVGGF